MIKFVVSSLRIIRQRKITNKNAGKKVTKILNRFKILMLFVTNKKA